MFLWVLLMFKHVMMVLIFIWRVVEGVGQTLGKRVVTMRWVPVGESVGEQAGTSYMVSDIASHIAAPMSVCLKVHNLYKSCLNPTST